MLRKVEHQLVLGGIRSLGELLLMAPQPGESGEGWEAAEGSRLGRLARRLWAPLQAREEARSR